MALFVALFLIASAATFSQPKIEIVGGETFDFGEIYKGNKVERKVMLKNIGTQALVIDRVQASCGCTATILEEKTIEPGKTASLSVGFDSKSFNGQVHKNVTVFSNDPAAPLKEVRFTAFVKEALTVSPPYIMFSFGKVDSTMTTGVTLKNLSDEKITILNLSTDLPGVKFDLKKKSLAPGEETQLAVTFTPTSLGYVNHDVVIKTSHPKQPEITTKLVCSVRLPANPKVGRQ